MSGGSVCGCPERKKPIEERQWMVTRRKCNYSAFNGYRHTNSDYSEVLCKRCRVSWRTKAKYVDRLPSGNYKDIVWDSPLEEFEDPEDE